MVKCKYHSHYFKIYNCLIEVLSLRGSRVNSGNFEIQYVYLSVLLTASPKPGVSTMVNLSLTPFSSILTVCLVICTVWMILSEDISRCMRCWVSERDTEPRSRTGYTMALSVSYLQHWAVFCPCKGLWGTGCSLEWIFPNPILLKQTYLELAGTTWQDPRIKFVLDSFKNMYKLYNYCMTR